MTEESMHSNFTSMHPTVEFLDILEWYSFNQDLHCRFKFNDYTSQEGDRIAIFKIGWNLIKDYVAFEWAPVATKDGQCSVIFNRHILPKNSTEVYQICYIGSENELHGASTPIQFHSGENIMSMSTTSILTSKPVISMDSIAKSHLILENHKDQEICRLQEENMMLKESLKAVILQNKGTLKKNCDKDIQEVKELIKSLKSMVLEHQKEIDILKIKITEGGEEYKKLYLEKAKIERKYEKIRNKREEGKPFHEEVKPINDCNFDIGDLKSMPPFPSILK